MPASSQLWASTTVCLKQHLQMIEHLEQTVSEFEEQIEAALEPFRAGLNA